MDRINLVLVHLALAALGVAAYLGLECVRRGRAGLLTAARGAVGAAVLLTLITLLRLGIARSGFPIVSIYEMLLCTAALLSGLALIVDLSRGLPILTLSAVPLSFLALLVAVLTGGPRSDAAPIDMGTWAGLHVIIMVGAYVAFEVSFLSGLLYLIQVRQLKTHAGTSVLGIMPALETVRRLLVRGLAAGVALMTAGILIGYLLGRKAGLPEGWRVDAKIWGTTFSWALYVAVLILSFVPSFKGRRLAVASVASFVIVLATFWIAAFLSNFHQFL